MLSREGHLFMQKLKVLVKKILSALLECRFLCGWGEWVKGRLGFYPNSKRQNF